MDSEILNDEWREVDMKLDDILGEIPFTQTQRRNIDLCLRQFEILFKKANHEN